MKTTIGIAVGYDCVRAVVVRGSSVRWAGEARYEGTTDLAEAIASLLGEATRRRWFGRRSVFAAIGPTAVQVRLVSGLPAVEDSRLLAGIVREGAARFFLRNGAPLVTSGVHVVAPGRAWAAAFDEPVVRAVVDGCAAARARLRAVIPAVAVLGPGLVGEEICWSDGPVRAEVRFAGGVLADVRRWRADASVEAVEPVAREALAQLGDRAWRFADAYGAAVLHPRDGLVLEPGRGPSAGPSVSRRRLLVAASAFVLAGLGAALAPGIAAERAGRRAAVRLAELAEGRRTAAAAEAQLRLIDEVLTSLAAFDASRRPVLPLLAEIADLLPPHAALISFEVRGTDGIVVAVAPQAGDVVVALERIEGIANPEIVGPVTPERIGEDELERVTIRFRLAPPASAAASAGQGQKAP